MTVVILEKKVKEKDVSTDDQRSRFLILVLSVKELPE